MPFSPESAFIACRFVHFLSLMVLFGQSAFIAFLTPSRLRPVLQQEGRTTLLCSAWLLVLSALVMVPIEAAQMGDGWQDAPRPDDWLAVLGAAFGSVWTWHLLLSVGATFLAIFTSRVSDAHPLHRRRDWPLVLLALACALLLLSLGLIGHAAMHAGWRGALQRINHATHLLSAGAWFGTLPPLLGCLRRLHHHEQGRDARHAVRRFSTVGHVAVALVLISGVANTGFVLQGWPIHWDRPYQALLDLKIALVLLMTGIAVYNRYHWVPTLKTDADNALRALKFNTYVEIFLGCAVLLLVATFATEDPR